MKITFLRLGFANNSSSCHSLIFTDKKLSTDESTDFGWGYFTAADRQAKLNYLLACLRNGFNAFANVDTYSNIYLDREEIEEMVTKRWHIFLDALGIKRDERYDAESAYVDHQSAITFPCHRDASKGLNLEFIKEFTKEIVENNYAILGGNDNDDNSHASKDLDQDAKNSIKELWGFLTDQPEKSVLTVKDTKTGEWVLSKANGPIMKVIF